MRSDEASRWNALRGRRAGPAEAPLDVVGLGECSIDEVWRVDALPSPDAKIRASERERLAGGQVATAIAAAARLGLRAGYVGAVGDDPEGAEVSRALEEEGAASWLTVVPGGRTRSALVLVDRGGARTVIE